jgi:hypothetical protein
MTTSATPMMDALAQTHDEAAEWAERSAGYTELLDNARQLEREPAAAQAEIAALREDAVRFEFLNERCLALDTEWGDRKETVLVFRWPTDARVGANLRAAIDSARKG